MCQGTFVSTHVPMSRETLTKSMKTCPGWPESPLTLAHLIWAAIAPVVAWVAHGRPDCPWTAAHGHCLALLSGDFEAQEFSNSTCTRSAAAEFAAFLLDTHLDIAIPALALDSAFASSWARNMPMCEMSVYILVMSEAMLPLIGSSLLQALQTALLSMAAQQPDPSGKDSLLAALKGEVLDLLGARDKGSDSWQSLPAVISSPMESKRKKSRTEASIVETLEDKTEMVRLSLVNNQALVHSLNTLQDAKRLEEKLQRRDEDLEKHMALEDAGLHQTTLSRHMLVLESAMDTLTKEALAEQRAADPDGFAIGIASDESPPSQVRFGGYRFQITMMYTPLWRPEETWEASEDPPLDAAPLLLDICHCPGKDGHSVMGVLDKQLSRVGLSRYDVCCGSGDGGGENEGESGIHASFEADNPGYIRRRCLGHIAWRLADAVLVEFPDYKLIKRLCEYLCQGSTWTRLQGLATTPVLEGGLGLFPEMSLAHAAVFGTKPGSIIPGRPENTSNFLIPAWERAHSRPCLQERCG